MKNKKKMKKGRKCN